MSTEQTTDPTPARPSTTPSNDGLWFKDGTLVIQAGSLSFRVYSGLLAETSPIFHDMLQVPQPEAGDLVEGCPVVRLSDNEQDVRCFLKAIFDYDFFVPFPAKTEFNTIIGILRLSTKYLVEPLRKRALGHLASAFPSDPMKYSPPTQSWVSEPRGWMRVLLLAREMSLDWVLPLAFYRTCARSLHGDLMNGMDITQSDGTTLHLELSPSDKTICLEQANLLARAPSSAMLNFLWEPRLIPGCTGVNETQKEKCARARVAARKNAEQWRTEDFPPFPLTLWLPTDWKDLKVCSGCLAAMKGTHEQAMRSFWDGLPQRFGLPEWAVLEQRRKDALA
ncbi:hypothetical protein B0H16DRAFT_1318922 [Mycena metata]|uniref:BTB domain-containing protein n=1 Tax=Mycena metata TaxID=1033252 RepID=A0AAD7N8C7_9AGAR|nr:hypothetical protein B0H16DRAFT_1318922 [Mycena metata]